MKILITGFQPFGGEAINPAYEAVKRLPDKVNGAQIIKKEIPVVFDEAGDMVDKLIQSEGPDAVICVGQAGGRKGITPERIGINLQEARIPDNAGKAPVDKKVREDGPAAYFTLLPVKRMVEEMRAEGLEASVSYSAGTYVCNDVMYRLLYGIERFYPAVKGGFIHVPFCKEQIVGKDGVPYMELEDIAKGLEICIRVLTEKEEKAAAPQGEIC